MKNKNNYFITGGAGFIGSNYVNRLLTAKRRVTIYDNLSRPGAKLNLQWLRHRFGTDAFRLVEGDIRNFDLLRQSMADAEVVVHLASQVAVTRSVDLPREDFEINALGTFNVLEAARLAKPTPIVLYASTNKVYGAMDDLDIAEETTRYRYRDLLRGVAENRGLDFHSPYGCSKGAGDQYVRDYFRIYRLPTVVFRQSCIYGPRQFGIEDQGWVAWFIIANLTGKSITICGDGKQVRDVLFVDDLLDAYDAAIEKIDRVAGEVFNIGGGPDNTISIWHEFKTFLNNIITPNWADWRPGDQRVYISDIAKARDLLGWQPRIDVREGISRLTAWVKKHRNFF